jgi:hypothetical protein
MVGASSMISKERDPIVRRVVNAFPVLSGKESDLDAFLRELAERSADLTLFYSQFSVSYTSWHRQEMPSGMVVLSITEIMRTPVSAIGQQLKASERPFDRWFKDRIKAITGVDLDVTPLGLPNECIFSWPE